MSITIETSTGVDNEERHRQLTIDEAKSAISELDGESTTLITLSRDDNSLYIAGGPDRFTVTFATAGNERVYDLLGDADAEGSDPRVIGGQLVDQPVQFLVTRDAAEAVAADFAGSGIVDVSSGWKEQV